MFMFISYVAPSNIQFLLETEIYTCHIFKKDRIGIEYCWAIGWVITFVFSKLNVTASGTANNLELFRNSQSRFSVQVLLGFTRSRRGCKNGHLTWRIACPSNKVHPTAGHEGP